MYDATVAHVVLGAVIGILSFLSIALNISVMLTLKTKGFLSSRKSTAYSLSFAYVFADIMEQSTILFYAAPSIFSNSYLVPSRDHFIITLTGFLFMVFWYMAMLYQIVIAIDRVNSIVFQHSYIRDYYRFIIASVWVVSLASAYIGFFVLPCCHFYISFETYGFSYMEGDNVTNNYLDIPFNLITTLTICICYTWIFLHVRKSNRCINGVPSNKLAERRQQEFMLARQFFIMAVLFTTVWVGFRVFPYTVAPNSPFLASIPIALSFHCSFNSIVFLSINSEFQQAYRQVLRGKMSASSSNNHPFSVTLA